MEYVTIVFDRDENTSVFDGIPAFLSDCLRLPILQ